MRSPQPVQVWLDHIHVDITDQVAVKTYHCTFKNPNGNAIVGGTCYMELEPGAQVDNMVVVVNGKESKAEILDVEKANQVFAEIVKEGGSPALLEYYGNQLIQTKVPKVAAGETITVKLTYTTLLKNRGGLVRLQMLNTNPKALMQPLKSASVTVNIKSQTPIKNLYSPTHEIKIVETPDWDVSAKWEQADYLPEHPFVLYYQTSESDLGASLLTHRELSEDGSFMLMLSPTVGKGAGQITEEQILPKDIVFCVDTSGSMIENKKMDQAKEALKYCIEHLRPEDRFNIVDFGTTTRNLSAEGLIPLNATNQQRALNYVEKLSARGGTAIQDALEDSLAQLKSTTKDGRLKMIVFATDGLPTIGEREPNNILKRIDELNTQDVRVFVFGEGFNVNTSLLDFLALNHRGESEYILPEEDISEKIGKFFDRVGSPIMTDLKVEFEGLNVADVYPRSVKDVFRGEQVVIYGRYSGHGKKTIRLTGKAGSETRTFEYNLAFPEVSEDDRNAFVPRLWAGQKVDFLLNEIRKAMTEDKELIEEVTFLAKRYGIVTPFTSFLVVDENCNAPQAQQVANFTYRMRNEKGGLRNEAVGGYAVTNFSRQAVGRMDLGRQGAAKNQYKQVEWALEKEGVQNQQAIAAVRYVGNRCFYNANNRWYDSKFDDTKQNMLQNVDIGSEEYLKLIKDNPALVKYMAQGESVVELKGQWYQFNARSRS
jgi:Ca-activated chloride channel family protein